MSNKWNTIQKALDAVHKGKQCPLLPYNISIEGIVDAFFPELRSDGCFDYALPITWVDEVEKVTGICPTRLFVWFYPKRELVDKYGASELPYPLSKDGIDVLKEYNAKTGYDYPVPSE